LLLLLLTAPKYPPLLSVNDDGPEEEFKDSCWKKEVGASTFLPSLPPPPPPPLRRPPIPPPPFIINDADEDEDEEEDEEEGGGIVLVTKEGDDNKFAC